MIVRTIAIRGAARKSLKLIMASIPYRRGVGIDVIFIKRAINFIAFCPEALMKVPIDGQSLVESTDDDHLSTNVKYSKMNFIAVIISKYFKNAAKSIIAQARTMKNVSCSYFSCKIIFQQYGAILSGYATWRPEAILSFSRFF